MATAEKPPFSTIDPEFQAAVNRVLKDVRAPESMRQSAKRLVRTCEEMRHRVLIRAARDEE
jgi:hypothetical protein